MWPHGRSSSLRSSFFFLLNTHWSRRLQRSRPLSISTWPLNLAFLRHVSETMPVSVKSSFLGESVARVRVRSWARDGSPVFEPLATASPAAPPFCARYMRVACFMLSVCAVVLDFISPSLPFIFVMLRCSRPCVSVSAYFPVRGAHTVLRQLTGPRRERRSTSMVFFIRPRSFTFLDSSVHPLSSLWFRQHREHLEHSRHQINFS